MKILVVGNILKDVYLNLDTRKERLESDQNGIDWLDLSFDASEHHFFNRNSSLGGSAISLEVLEKMGLPTTVSGSNLHFKDGTITHNSLAKTHRYILIADEKVSYFVPTGHQKTDFLPPDELVDYLYIDRSATLTPEIVAKILSYLDNFKETRLVVYINKSSYDILKKLVPYANLIFAENDLKIPDIDQNRVVHISEKKLSYLNIQEKISAKRVDVSTHLSIYSIASATILGGLILEKSFKDSLALARINVENSRLNSVLSLPEMQEIAENTSPKDNLELLAKSLVLNNKGILAIDESINTIGKNFAKVGILNTEENRKNWRNLLLTTKNLKNYVSGVILSDETLKQSINNGQNVVDFLTSRQIIPGIKVDQGLARFKDSVETYTKGLNGLAERLKEYFDSGLRFAKWRANFEIRLSQNGSIITPTPTPIKENCRALAEYAAECQSAGLVPILEPEVVYDGYYSIEHNAEVTGYILDNLFEKLSEYNVELRACILKINMISAGKNYEIKSTPEEVGAKTAEILRNHVPKSLAGVTFLSGGQTPDEATRNLSSVIKNGPFPWPVTFSFSRALQNPALSVWAKDSNNIDQAQKEFLNRLVANTDALKNSP